MPDGSFRFQVSSFKKQRSCEFQVSMADGRFKFQGSIAASFKIQVPSFKCLEPET